MEEVLLRLDSWVTAILLGLSMLAAWGFGWWRGWVGRGRNRESSGHAFHDASLALLGLLLGFTFSISLAKHEQRRQMVITDTNSIGDFLTCVSLLKDPVRAELMPVLRQYVTVRIAVAKSSWTGAELEQRLEEIAAMQDRMQELVKQAVDGGTPIVVPLVNTFNELTSSHAARLAAARDHLPLAIVIVLCLAAILAMVLTGSRQGATGERQIGATLAFVFLVCMVMQVTMDLNQPQRGLIRVTQEPLERLLRGMGR